MDTGWTIAGAIASIAGALASACGAIATIVIAARVFRWQREDQARRDATVQAERRRQLLTALRLNIGDNRDRAAGIAEAVASQVVFTNVDLSLLDATASLKYELLEDLDLCRRLDNLRAELRNAYTQIDQLRALDFDGTVRSLTLQIDGKGVSAYGHMRNGLVASLASQLSRLREQCDALLGDWPGS